MKTMRPRGYGVQASCGGPCSVVAEPAQREKLVHAFLAQRLEQHRHPKLYNDLLSDDAPVQVLERGALSQGGEFMLVRVEKPPGLDAEAAGNYPDMLHGTCVTRRPTDGFIIVTQVRAAPSDAATLWPVLVEACKATKIVSPE